MRRPSVLGTEDDWLVDIGWRALDAFAPSIGSQPASDRGIYAVISRPVTEALPSERKKICEEGRLKEFRFIHTLKGMVFSVVKIKIDYWVGLCKLFVGFIKRVPRKPPTSAGG